MKNIHSWFKKLSATGKVVTLSALTLLSFGTIGTFAQSGSPSTDATATTPPSATAAPKQSPTPVVITDTKIEVVAFQEVSRQDGSIPKGQTRVSQEGVNGERTITYEVTTLEGKETARKEVKNEVTKAPVDKVTLIGTYVAPQPAVQRQSSSCDPNYSGCVPIASDVDCAGGKGNGPAYVQGPIRVIGTDIYDLDRDGNGIACE